MQEARAALVGAVYHSGTMRTVTEECEVAAAAAAIVKKPVPGLTWGKGEPETE